MFAGLVREVFFKVNAKDSGMTPMVLLSCHGYFQLKENSTQWSVAK